MFAKHKELGEEIPEELVKLMQLASNLFVARELQSEVFLFFKLLWVLIDDLSHHI
jgi:hypothetical protein